MPVSFNLSLALTYKPVMAVHRGWSAAVVAFGDWWPRLVPSNIQTTADVRLLGIRPTYALANPTTAVSGTSTAGTYGVCLVYRSTTFQDGLTLDDIQSNRSNIATVTLTASQAAVLTKVVPSPADTKVNALDIYVAQEISSGIYGTFYRVVSGATNGAGTVTFNPQFGTGGFMIGAATSEGTVDTTGLVLATDNDFPYAQRFAVEVEGRCVMAGGIVRRVTATFTNGSPTVTVTGSETFQDGIYFWNIRRDSDTSGGIDGRGTYLCNYVSSTSVTLVDATGASVNYTGTTGSETTSVWTEPNRRFSSLLNPHKYPSDNVSNDYPSAILALAKVPSTSRVLLFGARYIIAEDYDKLPLDGGLNYISTEWGCSSHFSIVAANGRLFWLDLGKGKRQILTTDGTTVTPISIDKIKTILDRVTLDENGEVWRIDYIHGEYYQSDQTIRWSLYLDNNTVANYVLELDLTTGDLRGDPTFYGHRYQDIFTMGNIRGRNLVGQFGWNGGIARVGRDNVPARYRDWIDDPQLSGTLALTGQTTSTLTIVSGTLITSGIGLQGCQVMFWRENDASGILIDNPTYYHCRCSANTGTAISINYVETMNAAGEVTAVGTALPAAPSGAGWNYRVGVIQAIIGPKWFSSPKGRKAITFTELDVKLQGQGLSTTLNPIRCFAFENFDKQPRNCILLDPSKDGIQIADTTQFAGSFNLPKSNPAIVLGFALHDNSVDQDTIALNIEEITINYDEVE